MKKELARRGAFGHDDVYVLQKDGIPTISIRLDALARPPQTFHATWCRFEGDADGVRLCFGQRVGRSLLSRLDIAVGFEEFNGAMDSSRDFVASLFEQSATDPASWAVDSELPTSPDRYLADYATVVAMAFFGSHAELCFYRIGVRDLRILLGHATGRAEAPEPVVAVTMARRMLHWMISEMVQFRSMGHPSAITKVVLP